MTLCDIITVLKLDYKIMDLQKFNTHLSPITYGLIAMWAKSISFCPVPENIQISSLYSDLVESLPNTLTTVASIAADLYEDFVPMEADEDDVEMLKFIFNLIRVDMYVSHLVEVTRELNPHTLFNLDIQAHELIKEHILPMLEPDYENQYGALCEMGVFKVWSDLKAMMLVDVRYEQIMILLDVDNVVAMQKLFKAIEDVILNENEAYLNASERII